MLTFHHICLCPKSIQLIGTLELVICHLILVFLRSKNIVLDNELLNIFKYDSLDSELGACSKFSDRLLKVLHVNRL